MLDGGLHSPSAFLVTNMAVNTLYVYVRNGIGIF